MDAGLVRHVEDEVRKYGSDVWFTKDAKELMPYRYKCPNCNSSEFYKEKDILDVWFDSGSSHRAVLEERQELKWPAQMYLEGSDQHRGWFNSSLVISLATKGRAPFHEVLTHGFVVDENGRKMAKSIGNVINPQDIMKKYGADILRLWVASMDYRGDIGISEDILKQVTDAYRRIRNTIRFLLGNLYDFDPDKNRCSPENLTILDKWALNLLFDLTGRVRRAYENYEFHQVYHFIFNFCAVEMSSIYLDVLKDRLYTMSSYSSQRRSAQTVLFEIARSLLVMLSPVLSFTCEEAWEYLPVFKGKDASPQLSDWPDLGQFTYDNGLVGDFKKLLEIRDEVFKLLEELRENKEIGNSLEASVSIVTNNVEHSFFKKYKNTLVELLMVSDLRISCISGQGDGVKINAVKSKNDKCERCWKYLESVGSDESHPTLCDRCASIIKEMGN